MVAIKKVIDYNVNVRLNADSSGVETRGVKMSMNPFDEIAVEEAVRMKEKGLATETFAVSIGENVDDVLRSALAVGIDRVVQINTGIADTLTVVRALKEIVGKEKPDLIILGKQSIDDDANLTAQMLAGILGYPQGTFVSKLEFGSSGVVVSREVDEGIQKIKLALPAVISVDLRLNSVRFAKLPAIMKAKKQTIERIDLLDLGITPEPQTEILEYFEPPVRSAGRKLDSIDELILKIKELAEDINQ